MLGPVRTPLVGTCLATLFLFASCTQEGSTTTGPRGGTTGGTAPGGTTGSAGSPGSGGRGGTTASGGGGAAGANAPGGSTGTGTGGLTGAGGTFSSGGSVGSGGSTGIAGTTGAGGTTSSGGTSGGGRGGAGATGGTSATGGSSGTAGTGGGIVDMGGKPLATRGQCTSTSRGYFNLGDIRIINNRWGSDALNCGGTTQQVCVNSDGSIGWTFNRPNCGGNREYPDYPEVEFGVGPFGTGSSLLTTPAFSSTTLLPIQLSALNSASIDLQSFNITFQKPNYWNSNFEFWISRQDPTKNADAGVYAEVIIFLGWQANRQSSNGGWPCMVSGNIPNTNYNLCHQSDSWSSGKWRFFNFIAGNNPVNSYSGKVDIKAVLDWIRNRYSGFTPDMWLTRMEVGTEIEDDTQGTVKIGNLTFEVNGTSKSVQLGN